MMDFHFRFVIIHNPANTNVAEDMLRGLVSGIGTALTVILGFLIGHGYHAPFAGGSSFPAD